MGVISFARGVPAPECLPIGELADCARAVIERDGETALNYGPAGGYGPLREWLAERHGVAAGQIVVTNGSLQGLDLVLGHFAAERRLLVEAPTYDRALRTATRHGIDVAGDRPRRRGHRPGCARARARRRPAAGTALPAADLPEPERTNDLTRAAAASSRAGGGSRPPDPRGRSVPARALRRRGHPVPARARRRRSRPPLVVVLEDRRARAPRRLPRRPVRPRRRAGGGRGEHVSRPGLLGAGDRLRVPGEGPARAERRACARPAAAAARCAAFGAATRPARNVVEPARRRLLPVARASARRQREPRRSPRARTRA